MARTEKEIDFIFDSFEVTCQKFFVLKGECSSGRTVKVVHTTKERSEFELPEPGQAFRATGKWHEIAFDEKNPYAISHQFHADSLIPIRLTSKLTERLLQRIKGVGPAKASSILERLGEDLYDVLTNRFNFDKLVQAISPDFPKLAIAIAEVLYKDFDATERGNRRNCARLSFYQFIDKEIDGQIQPRVANDIFKMLGEPETFDMLLRNPYIAVGMAPWKSVDSFGKKVLAYDAKKRGFYLNQDEIRQHPERLLAAVFQATKTLLNFGDSCFTRESYLSELSPLLNPKTRMVDPAEALDLAISRGVLVKLENGLLQHIGPNHVESALTALLKRLDQTDEQVRMPYSSLFNTYLRQANSLMEHPLTPSQESVCRAILHSKFALLQGGAGVGKTTVMRAVVNIYKRCGGNVLMGCLSGKAALELTQSVKVELGYTLAQLLHGLGELSTKDPEYAKCLVEGIEKDREFTIPGIEETISGKTLLIIDEASMVDSVMLKALLSLLPPEVRLLVVGDHNQLPPIGWGQPFHDLVARRPECLNILTEVLRQGPTSTIPKAAEVIKDGLLPDLDYWEGQSEGIYYVDYQEEVQTRLHKMYGDEWLQVVALNDTVKRVNDSRRPEFDLEAYVAGRDQRQFIPDEKGLPWIHEGDKIICLRNRRAEGLFNGMIGVIVSFVGKQIMVKWDAYNEPRELSTDAWFDIQPAYAITVHKSQGSSAPAVVVTLEDTRLLNRQWLYTAVTRARKLVLIQKENSVLFERKMNAHLTKTATRTTNFHPSFTDKAQVAKPIQA